MAKKRLQVKNAHYLKSVEQALEIEKKQQAKRERQEIVRKAQKDALLKKLGCAAANPTKSGGSAPVDKDVDMKPANAKGVIRRIGKDKEKARLRAVLRVAKAKGENVDQVKRILQGKKKSRTRPNGKERTRDKKIRKARERRERRGCGPSNVRTHNDDDDDDDDDEDKLNVPNVGGSVLVDKDVDMSLANSKGVIRRIGKDKKKNEKARLRAASRAAKTRGEDIKQVKKNKKEGDEDLAK